MNIEKRNVLLYILTEAFRLSAAVLSTEAILQTFLYSIGFTQNQIYIQSMVYQALSSLIVLVGSTFADKGGVFARSMFTMAAAAVSTLVFLPLCFSANIGALEMVLVLVATAGISVMLSLHTVCLYKIPYYIFSPSTYGPATAVCGVIGSGISFLLGSAMTALAAFFEYRDIMIFALIVAASFSVLSGLMKLGMKPVPTAMVKDAESEEKSSVGIKELFTHHSFYSLLPGHFLRGVAMGTMSVLAVIASDYLNYSEEISTAMVSVSGIAVVLSCMLYGLTVKHVPSRVIILAGSLSFLLMPLLLIPNAPILFLVIYGILMFGRTLVDYGVPTEMLYVVPSRMAGPYNAWRLSAHAAGTLISTSIALFISTPAFITLSVVAQLVAGANFFFAKVMKRGAHNKGELLTEDCDERTGV